MANVRSHLKKKYLAVVVKEMSEELGFRFNTKIY